MANIAVQLERGDLAAEGDHRRTWRLPNCPFAMWVFDRRAGNVLAANDAALRLYGYPRQRLLSGTVDDLCRSALGSLLDLGLTNSPQTETVWHRRSDFSTFQTDISMIDCSGTASAMMVLVHPLLLSTEGDAKFTAALPLISASSARQAESSPFLAKGRT